MAVLKHLTIKKRDYGDIQRYLLFKCEEGTHKPIRDEARRMVPRDFYIQDGINCDPFSFDAECAELNRRFHKNQRKGEIMAHHYIISFDPKDATENGLTPRQAHDLSMEFANRFLAGHQALVVTHADGNNGSGNIHTHIVINSLRMMDVPFQPFMENARDCRAGYKHHLTDKQLHRMLEGLQELCEREHLHTVEVNQPSDRNVTDQEYRAQQRGQREKDRINARIRADGYEPIHPNYETVKQQIRSAIDRAATEARDETEFMSILTKKYNIKTHFKRGRYSFTHPKREKPIAGRSLGNAYQREAILEKVQMNQRHAVEDRPELAALPRIFLIPSDLRLVVDLQTCVKAQQSRAYARKVALSNLQRMARTVAWIQENGMGTIDTLALAKEGTAKQHQDISSQLRRTESDLRLVNRKIKHIGRYHSNRKLYARYGQAEDKDRFRAERRSEIEAYEESARELKSLFPDGNYPTLKTLRETKAALMEQRDRLKADLKPLAAEKKQLEIVWKNVHAILGSDRGIEVEQPTERSRQSIPTR